MKLKLIIKLFNGNTDETCHHPLGNVLFEKVQSSWRKIISGKVITFQDCHGILIGINSEGGIFTHTSDLGTVDQFCEIVEVGQHDRNFENSRTLIS